jgi:hypothetical protein
MQRMERNHLSEVEELEEIYEKKLFKQQSEYLSLE